MLAALKGLERESPFRHGRSCCWQGAECRKGGADRKICLLTPFPPLLLEWTPIASNPSKQVAGKDKLKELSVDIGGDTLSVPPAVSMLRRALPSIVPHVLTTRPAFRSPRTRRMSSKVATSLSPQSARR